MGQPMATGATRTGRRQRKAIIVAWRIQGTVVRLGVVFVLHGSSLALSSSKPAASDSTGEENRRCVAAVGNLRACAELSRIAFFHVKLVSISRFPARCVGGASPPVASGAGDCSSSPPSMKRSSTCHSFTPSVSSVHSTVGAAMSGGKSVWSGG